MVNTNPKRRGYLSLGSGRAICQLCGEKIANGVPQINHRANRCTASFHANAKDCGVPRSKKYIKEAGCSNCGMVLIAERGNCLNCFTMNAENFEAREDLICDYCEKIISPNEGSVNWSDSGLTVCDDCFDDAIKNAESSNTKLLGIGAGILATIFYMYFQK
jgi:hypothetical protein